MRKRKLRIRCRSAITGRFITEKKARRNPKTSIIERY